MDTFGDSLVLAASFEDVVLIDLATKAAPAIEVIFLDTEAHFPETLAFVEDIRARYDLNLTVTKPGQKRRPTRAAATSAASSARWPPCARPCREAEPGSPRSSGSTPPPGPTPPIVSWDEAFGLVKINPLATWTNDDIASYLADHDLPVHPLVSQGYLSIGCAPTTRPVAAGRRPTGRPLGRTATKPSAGFTPNLCHATWTTHMEWNSVVATAGFASSAPTATSAS